ncbi:hypothetical protein TEA_028314 [Camellia sinensis var. sinensis]|uniref:Uncharacterized protein n=1 Tax=Camellia sinensis var. sinensis TaxID=542762 RepID=A0A4S4DKP6_CAMSN|nr:hypothetical protein TEA_028314 [Camellia sinensis var. sinensis]
MVEEAPLVAENSETQTLMKKNHTRDVHILSSTFLLIFLAYGAVQNLESTFNTFVGNLMSLFLLNDGTRDAKGEETLPNSFVSFYSSMVSLSKSVMAPLFDLRMLLIIPFIAYSGLQQAFVCMERIYNFRAEYTKYIAEPALGESGVGGAMAVYGAFDAITQFTSGICVSVRWLGVDSPLVSSQSLCAGAFIHLIVLLWLLLKYSVTSGVLDILYPLLMAATLGIGDGIFKTQLNALLGMLFKHDMAVIYFCVSIAVVFFVSPYVSLHAVLVVMLVAVCISVVGFLFLTLMVEKAFSCAD